MSYYYGLEGEEMEDFKIKYDGDLHLIDANTLINSLLHFTNVVQEVNRILGEENNVEIKIRATGEGSFILDLSILSKKVKDKLKKLFSAHNVGYTANLIAIVGGLFGVAAFLKGEKPASVSQVDNSVTIINYQGDILIVDQTVYDSYNNNTTIRNSISRSIEPLNNDSHISGFQILDKENNQVVKIDREEFPAIVESDPFKPVAEEKFTRKEVVLNIVSLSFGQKKWDFLYEGNPVSAKIEDPDFLKRIEAGEKFAKGDRFEAEIEIRQEFDSSVDAYINRGYRVVRILKHIPRPEQNKLDFPD